MNPAETGKFCFSVVPVVAVAVAGAAAVVAAGLAASAAFFSF